jgi:hypothetical protein
VITVYKYGEWHLFELEDRMKLRVPRVHRFIHVAEQHEKLCLWAVVDNNTELVDVEVMIVGTGFEQMSDKPARHIGTALMSDGLVWHVFEDMTNANPYQV